MHDVIVKQLIIDDIEDSIPKLYRASSSPSFRTPYEITVYFILKNNGDLVIQSSDFRTISIHKGIQTLKSTMVSSIEKYFNSYDFIFKSHKLKFEKTSKNALTISFVSR